MLAESVRILESFRRHCRRAGLSEAHRTTLVSHHDKSVRFTNSTISVLKSQLEPRVTEAYFLVQPALRLRNASHVRRTGTMSPFGCYFMAFGALVPADRPELLVDICTGLFRTDLGFTDATSRFNAHAEDHDLIDLVGGGGWPVAVGDDPGPFRHVFGMDGVSGRNVNLCLDGPHGWGDVANVISIERDGEILGWEVALGVNTIARHLTGVAHPCLAGAGILAGPEVAGDLILVDALHSAVVLAMDGLEAAARGRGGNYRSFLRTVADRFPLGDDALRVAAARVAAGEAEIRGHASPAERNDLDVPQVVEKLLADVQRATS